MRDDELTTQLVVAATNEVNFERAKSNLRLQALLQNGNGRLQDCEVVLNDDGKSAVVYAYYSDDARTVFAEFKLAQPMSEAEFDGRQWARRLMRGK